MRASLSLASFLGLLLLLGPSPSAARGRISSLNRKPEPEPEPEPEPVEERDYNTVDGCEYLGRFRAATRPTQPGEGEETSDWGKTVYVGGFQGCLYHGQGVKTYSDGRVYDGEWVLGRPHGHGKFQYSNGNGYM